MVGGTSMGAFVAGLLAQVRVVHALADGHTCIAWTHVCGTKAHEYTCRRSYFGIVSVLRG
jgi:hypothetical protein